MSSLTVGVIGTGQMGLPIARRLLDSGLRVVVVAHRRREAVGALCAAGATEQPTVGRLAACTNVVITCLPSDAAVQQVVFGRDGVLRRLRPGSLFIDLGTTSPELTRRIAAALEQRGCGALDAPVSRGPAAATAGTLATFVGGPAEMLQRARPILDALSSDVFHVGPCGAGQTLKILNQLLSMVAMFNIVEVARLATALGVDLQLWAEVVSAGSGDSWMFQMQKPRLLAGNIAAIANQPVGLTNLELGLNMASAAGIELRIASATLEAFTRELATGQGD